MCVSDCCSSCVCVLLGKVSVSLCVFVALFRKQRKRNAARQDANLYYIWFVVVVVVAREILSKTRAHESKHTYLVLILINLLQIFDPEKIVFISLWIKLHLLFLFLALVLNVDLLFQTLSSICSQTHSRRCFFLLFRFVFFFVLHFQLAFRKLIAFSFVVFVESAGKEKWVH